jgi:hypothetical protein
MIEFALCNGVKDTFDRAMKRSVAIGDEMPDVTAGECWFEGEEEDS